MSRGRSEGGVFTKNILNIRRVSGKICVVIHIGVARVFRIAGSGGQQLLCTGHIVRCIKEDNVTGLTDFCVICLMPHLSVTGLGRIFSECNKGSNKDYIMKRSESFLNQNIVGVLLIFSIISWGAAFLPSKIAIVNFFGNLAFVELMMLFIGLSVHAFFYGWITDLILRRIRNEETNLINSIKEAKSWFPRSFAAISVGWAGIIAITFLVMQIDSNFLFSFISFLLGGLWITLSFTFYPLIIASRKSIFKSIPEALTTSIRSVNRWFHLLLLLFLISGGFVYIFIPQEIARQFTGTSENLAGWMVHFEWLGGYTFKPNWYIDYTRSLNIFPSKTVLAVLFFVNALIATVIKTKVTQILFESGYLSAEAEDEIGVQSR